MKPLGLRVCRRCVVKPRLQRSVWRRRCFLTSRAIVAISTKGVFSQGSVVTSYPASNICCRSRFQSQSITIEDRHVKGQGLRLRSRLLPTVRISKIALRVVRALPPAATLVSSKGVLGQGCVVTSSPASNICCKGRFQTQSITVEDSQVKRPGSRLRSRLLPKVRESK